MFTSHKIKVITNGSDEHREDFYCDICKYPFLTKDDFSVKSEFNCCHECYLTFAEARKAKWKEGWRPKQDQVDSYIDSKRKLYENN